MYHPRRAIETNYSHRVIYLIKNGDTNWYKLCISSCYKKRFNQMQSGNPERITLVSRVKYNRKFIDDIPIYTNVWKRLTDVRLKEVTDLMSAPHLQLIIDELEEIDDESYDDESYDDSSEEEEEPRIVPIYDIPKIPFSPKEEEYELNLVGIENSPYYMTEGTTPVLVVKLCGKDEHPYVVGEILDDEIVELTDAGRKLTIEMDIDLG